MGSALQVIEKARIPWLLAPHLSEDGRARIVSNFDAVPARFTEDGAGALTAAFRAARSSTCPEVRAYAVTAAQACGYSHQETSEGELWVTAAFPLGGDLVPHICDFVRVARSIAAAAAWLQEDRAARTWWSALAAHQVKKGVEGNDREAGTAHADD